MDNWPPKHLREITRRKALPEVYFPPSLRKKLGEENFEDGYLKPDTEFFEKLVKE